MYHISGEGTVILNSGHFTHPLTWCHTTADFVSLAVTLWEPQVQCAVVSLSFLLASLYV